MKWKEGKIFRFIDIKNIQLSKDKIDLEPPLGTLFHYICNNQRESKYEMCAL